MRIILLEIQLLEGRVKGLGGFPQVFIIIIDNFLVGVNFHEIVQTLQHQLRLILDLLLRALLLQLLRLLLELLSFAGIAILLLVVAGTALLEVLGRHFLAALAVLLLLLLLLLLWWLVKLLLLLEMLLLLSEVATRISCIELKVV